MMSIKKIIMVILFILLVYPDNIFAIKEKDLKFGYYVDRVITTSNSFILDPELNKRVTEIGNKIGKASGDYGLNYTFRIVNDQVVNARCASGGFIYINTGLLDIVESKDELAGIIGHEIAHANMRHQVRFLNSSYRKAKTVSIVTNTIGTAASIAGAGAIIGALGTSVAAELCIHTSDALISEFFSTIGGAVAQGWITGYGKKQEIEADSLAIKYMAKVGYDPNAMVNFFKKLVKIRNKLKSDNLPCGSNLINSEPGLEERIENIEGLITKTSK